MITEEYEKQILRKAIDNSGGNLTETAKRLGFSRASVYNNVKNMACDRIASRFSEPGSNF